MANKKLKSEIQTVISAIEKEIGKFDNAFSRLPNYKSMSEQVQVVLVVASQMDYANKPKLLSLFEQFGTGQVKNCLDAIKEEL